MKWCGFVSNLAQGLRFGSEMRVPLLELCFPIAFCTAGRNELAHRSCSAAPVLYGHGEEVLYGHSEEYVIRN